jgi:hypothetical protein
LIQQAVPGFMQPELQQIGNALKLAREQGQSRNGWQQLSENAAEWLLLI